MELLKLLKPLTIRNTALNERLNFQDLLASGPINQVVRPIGPVRAVISTSSVRVEIRAGSGMEEVAHFETWKSTTLSHVMDLRKAFVGIWAVFGYVHGFVGMSLDFGVVKLIYTSICQ